MSKNIEIRPIEIHWEQDLPIFASEKFLVLVGKKYGWLGGFDNTGEMRCILPYTILQKSLITMARFRVGIINVGKVLSIDEEKIFLNNVVKYFKSIGIDMIIPATPNTIFRIYPDGAIVAPYGTYIINLINNEDILWNNLHSKHRNVIRNAIKKGVQIKYGLEYLNMAYDMINKTLKRSKLTFMSYKNFKKLLLGLDNNVNIFGAFYKGTMQGCAVIPFSLYSAYYLYGGSISKPLTGSMNLLHWEAIRLFKKRRVKRYDFFGVRKNPEKGSKQYGLKMFKERFGGQLVQGYMWKSSFKPVNYAIYSLLVKLLRGGDIVDNECHKLHISS